MPGPNPIDGIVTAAQTLASGTGTVSSTGNLAVSGSSVAITVIGTATIENDGMINQTGTGRGIRDNTGGLTLTMSNEAGALLQAADADAIQMNKSDSSISLDNHGRIISLNASAGGAQAIDWNAITTGTNTLHNFDSGSIEAFEADAVRPGVDGSVLNEGTIQASTNTASSSDGVDGQTNTGIAVSNTGDGVIEGGRHGITAGAADETVVFTMSVTNGAGATIQGDDGSGLNIDGLNANETVTVSNGGAIIGDGVTGDGDGVDVDGIVNLTNSGVVLSRNAFSDTPGGASEGVTVGGGTITNYGTIEGDVAEGNVNAVGRGVTLAGIDTSGTPEPIYASSTITNGGLIKGETDSAIAVLGGASGFTVTIDNEAGGILEGGGETAATIQTGADQDTVNNAGAIVADSSNRAVDLGDGDDTLNLTGGIVNGDISGGTGSNTLAIDFGSHARFTYPGVISDFASVQIKSGLVTFSGANTYAGSTTISGGALIIANDTGSATGSGLVQVDAGGTLAGTGMIAGSVTIGSGSGRASLAPGTRRGGSATLSIGSSLTFQAGGTYVYSLKAAPTRSEADEVIANGVAIHDDANFLIQARTRGKLRAGTSFTVISNTSDALIVGTFANLADGAVISVDGNQLQASYQGGDGNDLTLTVIQ